MITYPDKTQLKDAILSVLHAKAGTWITFITLADLCEEYLAQSIYMPPFYRAVDELRKEGRIQYKKQSGKPALYGMPDTETIDMFEE